MTKSRNSSATGEYGNTTHVTPYARLAGMLRQHIVAISIPRRRKDRVARRKNAAAKFATFDHLTHGGLLRF